LCQQVREDTSSATQDNRRGSLRGSRARHGRLQFRLQLRLELERNDRRLFFRYF
jgi:hypothetical protein